MFKDAILGLGPEVEFDPARDLAISLAKDRGLHVLGVSFSFVPVYPATTPMELFGADYINAYKAENRSTAKTAADRFMKITSQSGVKGAVRTIEAPVAEISRQFAEMARHFDLVIMDQPKPDHWHAELIIEAVLFESGRPVIVVPYIYSGEFKLDHVTVCWDGSRAAARAIADALPLLQRARKVDILTVRTAKGDEFSISGMEGHLARHGVKASAVVLTSQKGDEASAILNHASDTATNLIVMGGYGHSRLREFVLGGVTLGLLRSMTAPVLMSH